MSYWSEVKAEQQKKAQLVSALVGYDAGREYATPDPSIYTTQASLYQKLSWVYGAITPVTVSVASLAPTLGVYQLNGEEKTPVKNHPFEQLLRAPNDIQFDSQFEFYQAIAGYLKLNGNCYLWANALTPELEPAELFVLRPDRMTLTPDKNNFIAKYTYTVENESVDFDPTEIVHLKMFHPLNDYYGLSAIEAIMLAAESDYKQSEWNRNFFARDNAKPQGALAFSEFHDDENWKIIKSDIDREYGGTNRRVMKIRGAGAGGVQWIQMGFTQKDMEFLAGRQFSKEEIFNTLAPGLLAMTDKNVTEANAIAGEKTYREYTLFTLLQLIAQKFSARLLKRYGDNLVCEFDDIRHRDRRLEIDEQTAYARTHTVDEVRKKYYGDDPLGDERGALLPAQVTANVVMGPTVGNDGVDNSIANSEQRQANDAAKTLERKQFRAWYTKRLREGKHPKLSQFKFNCLDGAEQRTLMLDMKSAEQSAFVHEHDAIASKAREDHTGIMIAFEIPKVIGEHLLNAVQSSVPSDATLLDLDELHITLAYLGDLETIGHSRETIEAVVRLFAATHPIIQGTVNGIGRFNKTEDDGTAALYASFDSPELPTFQLELMNTLAQAGIAIPREHGFIPHITLAYVPKDAMDVAIDIPSTSITFSDMVIAWSGHWKAFNLMAAKSLGAQSSDTDEFFRSPRRGESWQRYP